MTSVLEISNLRCLPVANAWKPFYAYLGVKRGK
jgi:hypothetical protein